MAEQFNFQKRILFVGMPDTAYTTLYYLNRAGVNVIAVVPPPKNHPAHKAFADFASNMGYTVISPLNSVNEPEFIMQINKLNADLAVVTSYSEKFSKEFINATKDGFVNAHPSLLPEYRGANPYSHVIINGEKQTGVTLHKMDENYDCGDIIMQVGLDIAPDETMGTLFNKLNRLTGDMLVQFLVAYETTGMPQGTPQATLATPVHTAPKIQPDSGNTVIRWERPAVEIERFIRGLNPFTPAGTRYKGIYVKVFSAEACTMKTKQEPGTILGVGNTIDVATGNGVLKIKVLQFANYFVGSAADFAQRVKFENGDRFELLETYLRNKSSN